MVRTEDFFKNICQNNSIQKHLLQSHLSILVEKSYLHFWTPFFLKEKNAVLFH